MFLLGCYCYIADISKPEDRTIRLIVIDALFFLGYSVGNAFAGPIKTNLGLSYNFAFGILFTCISASYTLIRVKESLAPINEGQQNCEDALESDKGNIIITNGPF